MKMTIKEEYMKYIHECESLVQNDENIYPDISGGIIKYIRLSKMLNYDKYLLNCAYKWGIFFKKRYDSEMIILNLMRKALMNYTFILMGKEQNHESYLFKLVKASQKSND